MTRDRIKAAEELVAAMAPFVDQPNTPEMRAALLKAVLESGAILPKRNEIMSIFTDEAVTVACEMIAEDKGVGLFAPTLLVSLDDVPPGVATNDDGDPVLMVIVMPPDLVNEFRRRTRALEKHETTSGNPKGYSRVSALKAGELEKDQIDKAPSRFARFLLKGNSDDSR